MRTPTDGQLVELLRDAAGAQHRPVMAVMTHVGQQLNLTMP